MMVGGPYNYAGSDYIQKTFSTSSIPYYKIGVRIDVYKIDYWNGASFVINAGYGTLTNIFTYSFSSVADTTYVRNLCAGCYNEDFLDVYQEMTFSGSNIEIQFTTTLGSTSNSYWGINSFQLYIFRCDPSCLSCSDETANGCLTCYTYATINTSNACNCNNGYYMVIPSNPCLSYPCSTCTPCNSACDACSGGTSASCLSCPNGYYLSSNQCPACDSTCKTCETNSTNCLSCNSGQFLNTASNTCQTNCPIQDYGDTDTNTCQPCSSICGSCSGSSTTCITCNATAGYYLSGTTCLLCNNICATCQTTSTNCTSCSGTYLQNNTCQSTCPTGYYERSDYTCQLCDTSCSTCSAGGSTNCNSCPTGYYLSPSTTGGCMICDVTCNTCNTTSTTCLSCNSGTYLYSNTCPTTCPNGYYKSISDNTCKTCDTSCAECSAAGSSACTGCATGYYLTAENQCSVCSGCASCVTTATNCLSCSGTTYLNGNTCVAICPNGEWPRSSDNTCQNCDSSCQTCVSPGTSTSCSTCNSGFYISGTTCQNCSIVCSTCITNAITCLSCPSGSYLFGSNCISSCPDGNWPNTANKTCDSCDSSCLTCQFPGTSTSCLTCSIGLVINGQCTSCTTPCKNCTGVSTNCTSCTGGYYLTSNQCETTCPDGYYADPSTNTCLICNAACLTCNEMFAINCLSCSPGFVLMSGQCLACDTSCTTCSGIGNTDCITCNGSLYYQQGSCVGTCGKDYYIMTSPMKQCIKCPTTCLTCVSTDVQQCLTCATNCYFTLINNATSTGSCLYLTCPANLKMDVTTMTCVQNCDSGEYYDANYNQCKVCNSLCTTCTGPYSNNCTSCNSSYFLYLTSCLTSCPPGRFTNYVTNTCDQCTANCDACDNSSVCNSCAVGYFLVVSNQTCSNDANNGQFINYTDGTIGKCTYGCMTCTTSPQCITCQPVFYLNSENICTEETHVQPILTADSKAINVYYLTFNDTWTNFFTNLTNSGSSYNLSIENLTSSAYTCNLIYYIYNKTVPNWQIMIIFNNYSLNTTELIVNLFPPVETPYRLTQTQVTANVPPYNINDTLDLTIVTPSLTYLSADPLILNLSFSSNFSDFFDIIDNVTSINIENFDNNTYKYTLNRTNNRSSQFNVELTMFTSILGTPKLTITFNLPGYLIYDPIYRLSPQNVSIYLNDYFVLDSFAKSQVNFINDYSSSISSVFVLLAFLHGTLNFGSLSFSGIQAVNIIKYLRYLIINYPPNALSIFKSDFTNTDLFGNLNNVENQQNIPIEWVYYGINSNFFSNGKDKLLQLAVVLGLGIIFQLLARIFNKSNGFIAKVIKRLETVFFLNFFLMLYFTYLMDLCFYCFVNMKYVYLDSTIGILSLLTSIVFIIFTLIVHIILFKLILGNNGKNSKVSPKKKGNDTEPSSFEKLPVDGASPLKFGKTMENIVAPSSREYVKRKTWWNSDEVKSGDDSGLKLNNSKPIIPMISSRGLKQEDDDESPTKHDTDSDKLKEETNKPDEGLNKKILILLEDYRQISKTQKLYIMFLMIRYFMLPCFVIGLYEQTYLLISIYFGFNLMFLAYIACLNPFKGWSLLILNILVEVGIMGALTGGLLLYISQLDGINDYDDRIYHGSMIFYGNLFVIFTLISAYIWEIFILLVEKIGSYCANKKNKVQNLNASS